MFDNLNVILSKHLNWLIVQSKLLEALWPRLWGKGLAHHADNQSEHHIMYQHIIHCLMSPEACVIVGCVGLCAGLHKVTVALILAMLTFELIAPIHIDGVGITICHKVNMDILAKEIVHGPNLICNETVKLGEISY